MPLAFALTGLLALLAAGPALADRPGTPNQERAEVAGPDTIRVSWHDSAQVNQDFASLAPTVIFEVQGDTSSGYLTFQAYEPGDRLHWDVLAAPGRHCYRIWSRNMDDQLRSAQPSAWACAVLPPMIAPVAGMMSLVGWRLGKVSPMVPGVIVWLNGAPGMLTPQTDGFLLDVESGRGCPSPWKAVHAQNGGIPGLGAAHRRDASDAYWLCWSPGLPQGYDVDHAKAPSSPPVPVSLPRSPPPPPAHRIDGGLR